MDTIEFRLWLKHHKGAYPGLAIWLKANPDQIAHWGRLVELFDLAEAIAATNRLVEAEDQPRGYKDHPREIKARILADRGVSGRVPEKHGPVVQHDCLVSSCARCQDYGVISILSPRTVKQLRAGECHGLVTCVIACDCANGYRWAKTLPRWSDRHSFVRYDDVLNCMADGSNRDMIDIAGELLVAIDGRMPTVMAN